MDKKALRQMILNECGCMAREGELPNSIAALMPMLDVLGYGRTDGAAPMMTAAGGMSFEDSDAHEESSMIKNNLFNLATQAQELHDAMEDGDELPEWVQEKIAVATAMIDTIYDYIHAETAHTGMNEAKKPWYMKKRRNLKKTNEAEWYDMPKTKSRSLKKKR